MQWNVGDFNIVCYNADYKEHYQFGKELIDDSSISRHMSNEIKRTLQETNMFLDSIFPKAYLVESQSLLIGYLYLGNCDLNGVISLTYALHKYFRKQHIGSKMLKQVSEFLIQNVASINNIDLAIDRYNIAGVKTALAANFEFYKHLDDVKHYRYYI